MSTVGAILNIARSAISAHQTAVRIASQNISNAQTEGYSRQSVRLVDTKPDITPLGRLGTGVKVQDIARVRDSMVDSAYRRESGRSASYSLRHGLLSQVEGILGEPSDTGLSASLDAFYSAWSDLSNQPASDTAKRVIVQRSESLAGMLNSFATRIDELVQSTRTRVSTTLEEINRITEQLGAVNDLIVREEAGGLTASDLRDQRDRLVDQLAQLGSIRTMDRDNGAVAVVFENALVVDGGMYKTLTATGDPPVIQSNGVNVTLASEGSVLGELVGALSTRIPAVVQRLDDLANALVVQTNALHNAGFLPDGTPGTDFFDPASTTARSINVVATSDTVVASDSATEPNNNRIALAMAGMRLPAAQNAIASGIWTAAEAALLGGLSAQEHYRTTVTDLAVDVRTSDDSMTVYNTLAEQLDIRRQSISGVSVDEELIRVMQHQQSYTAAARMVTVVDEMIMTILDLKR